MSNDFYTDLSVGEILRRARLQTGESIEDTAAALRIRVSYLQALERSDFKALPGSVYVIGFVRAYAEHVGLDGARTVDLLKRQTEMLNVPTELTAHVPTPETRLPSVPIVGAAFAAILMVVTVWIAYQGARLSGLDSVPAVPAEVASSVSGLQKRSEAEKPSVQEKEVMGPARVAAPQQEQIQEAVAPIQKAAMEPTVDAVVPAETVSEPVAPPAAAPVEIRVTGESWIELRTPDGKVAEARIFRAGETLPIAAPVDANGKPYALTISNAGGVEILVSGKPVGSLGQKDQVRRNIALNPKTLIKLAGSD